VDVSSDDEVWAVAAEGDGDDACAPAGAEGARVDERPCLVEGVERAGDLVGEFGSDDEMHAEVFDVREAGRNVELRVFHAGFQRHGRVRERLRTGEL